MLDILIYKQDNKDVNHYIRLGKILHYHNGGDLEKWDTNIEHSTYRTTDGQHEIKQSEAFVKSWLTAISSAIRTMQYWIDPHHELASFLKSPEKYDLLIDGKKKNETLNQNDQLEKNSESEYFYENALQTDHFHKQAKFIFGEFGNNITKDDFLKSLRLLETLRNTTFHFKKFQKIQKILLTKDTAFKNANDFYRDLYQADQKSYIDILKSTINSINAHYYLEKSKIENLLNILTQIKTDSLLPLPKLSRLLLRYEHIKTISQKDKILPDAPNRTLFEQEKNEYLRVQYTLLKMVYEKPFRDWLNKVPKDDWQKIAKAVTQNTTAQAKIMNSKTTPDAVLMAKTEKIDYKKCKTISDLFFELSAESAREFAVQSGYESNREQAAEQAAYIEDFKCDIVAQLFAEYIKDNFDFLLKNKMPKKEDKPYFDTDDLQLNKLTISTENWEANLYFILHLIPVEEVNLLMHQLRKFIVVTTKTQRTDEHHLASRLIYVMSLYNDMHDAKFINNSDIDYSQKFKQYYEGHLFDAIFPKSLDRAKRDKLLPIRGLREIMRYGDMKKLDAIFQNVKFTRKNYNRWEELKKTIDKSQHRKEELHKIWEGSKRKGNPPFTHTQKIEYNKLVQEISEYSAFTKQAYLINHKNLHRLIMQIFGRLIGYSHQYERDWYFITLAKIYEMGKKPSDILENQFENIKNGQINAVFKKEQLNDDYLTLKTFVNDKIKFSANNQIRNDLAHFNMLNQETGTPFPITKWINDTRTLMSYDRKLKNAVAKSIRTIFEKEKMDLFLTADAGHNLTLNKITPQKAKHLDGLKIGENAIEEPLHSDNYIEMVKSIF